MSTSTPRAARGVWAFPGVATATLVAAAQHAEDEGLDEFWLGDEGPARDPFITLAAVAAATRRIRIGVAVTNPYLRHPLTTAVEAMTIDELSGGRMMLGLGPGGKVALDPVGVPRERPLAAVREAIRLIRAVADGRRVPGYAPPADAFTRRGLKVYIGSRSRRFQELASEVADGVFLGGIPWPVMEQTLDWARSVRPIDVHLYSLAVFEPEGSEALRPVMIMPLADSPSHVLEALGLERDAVVAAAERHAQGDDRAARTLVTPEVFASLVLAGTPRDVGRRLVERVRTARPTAVGFTFMTDDLHAAIEASAAAFRELDAAGL